MKYLDKKYKLGTTKNICRTRKKKQKGGGWGMANALQNVMKGGWGSPVLAN